MKYIGMPLGMWILFHTSFRKKLVTVLGFASVTSKSYVRGCRDIYKDVGLFHRLMIRFGDSLENMRVVRMAF